MNTQIIIFIAVVVGVMGIYRVVYDLYLNRIDRIRDRLKEDIEPEADASKPQSSPLFKDSRAFLAKIADRDDLEIARRPLREVVDEFILQSGMDVTVKSLLRSSAIFAGIFGTLTFVFYPSVLMTVFIAALTGTVPWVNVQRSKKRRQEALLKQLPDAFELIARVLRSGQSIGMAIKAVADEFEEPLGREAAYCYEQQNLGLSPEAAFRNLANRTGILEVRLFVTALSVQQKTGGNLAELIDKLSSLIRDRFRLRGQIQTLTAEGRFQAILLLSLPFALFVILTIMNPEYELELLKHPRLILSTLGMMAFGGVWIKKIVSFDG
jgi:tight adherence protein B